MSNKIAPELLLNNLSTAVLLLDENLCIYLANHAAQSMLELSERHLYRRPLHEVLSDFSITSEHLKKTLSSGEGFSDAEVAIVFHDGRHTKADLTVTRFDYDTEYYLLVELKQVDQQKKISQENQHYVQQQAARELIRGLAHEIKNPLGGIRGAAQLLQKDLAKEHADFTALIIEQSDRLRNLVDRLLGPNALPDFNLHNVHQILEKVRTLSLLDEAQGIEFVRDYDPSIPDIHMDPEMIQQAILNIVRNAVQAIKQHKGRHGVIRMITRIERQMTIQGERYPLCVKIKIVDNGPGIPEAIKDTLFFPMVTSKQDGSGLGLSISQTLVNHHKGRVDVDSWPGQTEFILYLPITDKEALS